jgi:hypothetical protein
MSLLVVNLQTQLRLLHAYVHVLLHASVSTSLLESNASPHTCRIGFLGVRASHIAHVEDRRVPDSRRILSPTFLPREG